MSHDAQELIAFDEHDQDTRPGGARGWWIVLIVLLGAVVVSALVRLLIRKVTRGIARGTQSRIIKRSQLAPVNVSYE